MAKRGGARDLLPVDDDMIYRLTPKGALQAAFNDYTHELTKTLVDKALKSLAKHASWNCTSDETPAMLLIDGVWHFEKVQGRGIEDES